MTRRPCIAFDFLDRCESNYMRWWNIAEHCQQVSQVRATMRHTSKGSKISLIHYSIHSRPLGYCKPVDDSTTRYLSLALTTSRSGYTFSSPTAHTGAKNSRTKLLRQAVLLSLRRSKGQNETWRFLYIAKKKCMDMISANLRNRRQAMQPCFESVVPMRTIMRGNVLRYR